jgi:hypothetical protein
MRENSITLWSATRSSCESLTRTNNDARHYDSSWPLTNRCWRSVLRTLHYVLFRQVVTNWRGHLNSFVMRVSP